MSISMRLTICVWVVAPVVGQAAYKVNLKVIDGDKKPVAKAVAAINWESKDGKMTPGAKEDTVTTDANGKGTLTVNDFGLMPTTIFVLSEDQSLAAFQNTNRLGDAGKELEITLTPTIKVSCKVTCGAPVDSFYTLVQPEGARHLGITARGASWTFHLPEKKYEFWTRTFSPYVEDTTQAVTLDVKKREHDMGTVELKASDFAKMKGKPAPEWTITDARNIAPTVKLSDYKGKWVYIEFWGFW
jgi:hypothetical protein